MEHIFVENLRCYIINTKLSEESWEYSSRKKKQEQASASEEAATHTSHRGLLPSLLWKANALKSAAHYPLHECSVFKVFWKKQKHFLSLCFPQMVIDNWVIICNSVLHCMWSPAVSVMHHLCQHILWNPENCCVLLQQHRKLSPHAISRSQWQSYLPFVSNRPPSSQPISRN